MNFSAYWEPSLLLLAFASAGTVLWTAAISVDKAVIAKTIKTDVAEVVAGLNAHDEVKTTAYDAPNIISMECGSPQLLGSKPTERASRRALLTTILEGQSHRRDCRCCE